MEHSWAVPSSDVIHTKFQPFFFDARHISFISATALKQLMVPLQSQPE